MQSVSSPPAFSRFEVRGPLTWLRADTARVGSTFLVTMAGQADYGNLRDQSVEALLGRYQQSGCADVAVDLGAVTSADSTGMSWLLRLWDAAESRGSGVTLRNVPRHLQRLLVMSGIAGLFAYEDG